MQLKTDGFPQSPCPVAGPAGDWVWPCIERDPRPQVVQSPEAPPLSVPTSLCFLGSTCHHPHKHPARECFASHQPAPPSSPPLLLASLFWQRYLLNRKNTPDMALYFQGGRRVGDGTGGEERGATLPLMSSLVELIG